MRTSGRALGILEHAVVVAAPSTEKKPTSQVHCDDPAALLLPAGHAVQLGLATSSVNVLAGQTTECVN
jgi:hypothetical protein